MKKFNILILFIWHSAFVFAQNVTMQQLVPQTNIGKVETFTLKQSPFANYYFKEISINGIPVFGFQEKLILPKNQSRSIKLIHGDFDFKNIKTHSSKINNTFLSEFLNHPNTVRQIFFKEIENLTPAYQIKFSKNATHYEEVILDENGIKLFQQDLLKYHKNDSLFKVWVHNLDPLTSSNTIYGDSAIDNQDSSTLFLEKQLSVQYLSLNIDSNKTIQLANKHAIIKEFSNPITVISNFNDSISKVTRNLPAFEDLNVLFHIENFNNYLTSIGYADLVNYQIEVDAHGFNGADQSSFNGFSNPPQLTFGTGGVDDAEDADVIIHEFGHAIYNSIAPNATNGIERAALEEAFGDYLASSYSRRQNAFNWHQVFNWDGHNEFWIGRIANSTKIYPNDINNNIYTDGELFNGALMEIWSLLGPEKCDQLVIESIFGHINNLTMQDAAKLIVYADDIINEGSNKSNICNVFIQRGLLNNCPTIGLAEKTKKSGLEFYLNQKTMHLSLPISNALNVSILNVLGQEVYSFTPKMFKNEIDLSYLPLGIYILQVGVKSEKFMLY